MLTRQNFHRLLQRFTGDDANVMAVMEKGEDIEPDIFVSIGNHSHDGFHASLVAEVHHQSDIRDAGDIHDVQRGQVGEKTKARFEVWQEQLELLSGLFGFVCVDAA